MKTLEKGVSDSIAILGRVHHVLCFGCARPIWHSLRSICDLCLGHIDEAEDQWYYLADNKKIAFSPNQGDRLIASVDFTNDTVEMMHSAGHELGVQYHGIETGVLQSDISSGKAVYQRKVSLGQGGDQLFYDVQNDHLYMSCGANGSSAYLKVFDATTGKKLDRRIHSQKLQRQKGLRLSTISSFSNRTPISTPRVMWI